MVLENAMLLFFSKMTTEELGIVFPFRISSARKYVILYPVHTNLFSMFTVNALHAWTLGDVRFQYSREWFVNEFDWHVFATRLKDKDHVSNNRIIQFEDFALKRLKMAEILIKIKIEDNSNALAFVERTQPYLSKTNWNKTGQVVTMARPKEPDNVEA